MTLIVYATYPNREEADSGKRALERKMRNACFPEGDIGDLVVQRASPNIGPYPPRWQILVPESLNESLLQAFEK